MSKKDESLNTNTIEKDESKSNIVPKREEKRVKIIIPKDPLNKNNTFVPVGINGKIYQINRGMEADVPVEVANILRNAGYIS